MSYEASNVSGLGMLGLGFAEKPLEPGPIPTLKLGSKGSDVGRWQRFVGVSDDGIFGQDTLKATKNFQASVALSPDGIVGPKTWAAAAAASIPAATQQAAPTTKPATKPAKPQLIIPPFLANLMGSQKQTPVSASAPSGSWWAQQSTPTKVAIVGGGVAVLAAVAWAVGSNKSAAAKTAAANSRR